jgi:hypothetical protein
MRSVTFGPIGYFDSSLRGSNESEEPPHIRESGPSQLISSSHNSERYHSTNSSLRLNEVVFYAGENLYRETLIGHREVAMKKYCKVKFSFDSARTY